MSDMKGGLYQSVHIPREGSSHCLLALDILVSLRGSLAGVHEPWADSHEEDAFGLA